MGEKARKCRLWWPSNLSSNLEPHSKSSAFFFGWFIFSESHTEPCFDIVVAFSVEGSALCCSTLQVQLSALKSGMALLKFNCFTYRWLSQVYLWFIFSCTCSWFDMGSSLFVVWINWVYAHGLQFALFFISVFKV